MKREVFSKIGGIFGILFFLFLISPCFATGDAQSEQVEQAKDSPIQLLNPEEESATINKKARIKCAIGVPFDPAKLLVLLDGADISGVLDIGPDGFEYKSNSLLPSGEHTLSVTLTARDGQELKKEFKFSTAHSKVVDEIYSHNEVTTLVEKKAAKTGNQVTPPSWKLESNLASESLIKENKWEFNFKTNLRYFDQNTPVSPVPGRGFSLANYLFQGKYGGETLNFLAEAGDVTITETPFTVSGFARRGGNMVLQLKDLNLTLRTFDVKTEQLFGFRGGTGLGTTPQDHLFGASAELGLFSDKLQFRTIYVRGGEQLESMGTPALPSAPGATPGEKPNYGISGTTNQKKGNVLGFLLTSNFFDRKLVTEAELGFSRYDPDTSDEFRAKGDKAYRVKAGGTIKDYTYEALYEYIGPEYEVIGNPGLQKNKEGYALRAGGTFFKVHGLNVSFSQYHDNVKKDALYPIAYTTQGTLDYTFSKFENIPIGLSYQRSMLKTKEEPVNIPHTRTDNDAVTGRINYIRKPWNFGFMISYSFQNDRTDAEHDTTTVTYTFTPAYHLDSLSINPGFSYNRSLTHLTHVRTNLYTATLDLRGDLFQKKMTYGLGSTYTVSRSSDGLAKQYIQNANFNVYYLLFKDLWGFLNPSVGIRGLYNRTNDKMLHKTTDEFALYLMLQTTMKFLF